MSEHVIYVLGPFRVPGLGLRHARVYVPQGSAQQARPLLVLFDGQNVFHDAPSFSGGWYAHHAVDELASRGANAPVVLALDHGGPARIHELSPFAHGDSAGKLDRLLDWMAGRLLPRIEKQFRTRGDAEGRIIGGSSMGGLAAIYAHLTRPQTFGRALVMSPSLWFADGRLVELARAHPVPQPSRLYLDAGAREDDGSVARNVEGLGAVLRERGYPEQALRLVVDPEGEHRESDWRRRMIPALEFLLAPAQAVAEPVATAGPTPEAEPLPAVQSA